LESGEFQHLILPEFAAYEAFFLQIPDQGIPSNRKL
jgi:hypothetical protein